MKLILFYDHDVYRSWVVAEESYEDDPTPLAADVGPGIYDDILLQCVRKEFIIHPEDEIVIRR